MKKIFFAISALAMMLVSCDPSTDDISSGFNNQVTAETVQASATPVVINGKKTNRIVVENHSPITCQWKAGQLLGGQTSSAKSYDTIYVSKTGVNTIQMVCHNLNGDFTKEFTVEVDEIAYIPDDIQKRLGDNVKEFNNTFDKTKVEIKQMLTDGKEGQGNLFQVINNSGQLSYWRLYNKTTGEVSCSASNNSDMVYTMDPGDYTVFLDYTKADGTTETYSAGEFTIPDVTYIPEVIVYLRDGKKDPGAASSEWQWFQGNAAVWGNGPWASGDGPAWWTNNLDSMDGNGGGKPGGTARNGINATFTLNFETFDSGTAVNSDGTTCPFKVYPLKHGHDAASGWDMGCLHFDASGSTYVVPMAVNVNGGDEPFQDMYIVKASGGRLNLTSEEQAVNGCAWFFLFEQKK